MAHGLTIKQELLVLSGPTRLATALRILKHTTQAKNGATCHECLAALGVAYQTGSTRYSRLVKTGCLERTGEKRLTPQGGLAAVYRVPKTADFRNYLHGLRVKSSVGSQEKGILRAGKSFLRKLERAQTQKAKEAAAVALVKDMLRLQ